LLDVLDVVFAWTFADETDLLDVLFARVPDFDVLVFRVSLFTEVAPDLIFSVMPDAILEFTGSFDVF